MQSGIIYPLTGESVVFHTNGPISSTETELQAIERVLRDNTSCRVIDIYTDSLTAIQGIVDTHHSYTSLHKHNSRTTLKSIRLLTLPRSITTVFSPNIPLEGVWLRLFHVFSHSDTKPKKRTANIKRYGQYANYIMSANIAVDNLVGTNNTTPSTPHPSSHPCADICHFSTPSPFPSVKAHIASNLLPSYTAQWVAKTKAKAKRFLDPSVSFKYSTHLLTHKKSMHYNAIKVLGKALTASFPTKKTVHSSISYRTNPFAPKMIKFYSNSYCNYCLGSSPSRCYTESHTHLLWQCPAVKAKLNTLPDKLLHIINTNLNTSFSTFPWWFPCTAKPWRGDKLLVKNVVSFDKALGARGFIPAGLYKVMYSFCNNSDKVDKAMLGVCLAIAFHLESVWKDRCNNLFKSPVIWDNKLPSDPTLHDRLHIAFPALFPLHSPAPLPPTSLLAPYNSHYQLHTICPSLFPAHTVVSAVSPPTHPHSFDMYSLYNSLLNPNSS
jgi:hypothetical protein